MSKTSRFCYFEFSYVSVKIDNITQTDNVCTIARYLFSFGAILKVAEGLLL